MGTITVKFSAYCDEFSIKVCPGSTSFAVSYFMYQNEPRVPHPMPYPMPCVVNFFASACRVIFLLRVEGLQAQNLMRSGPSGGVPCQ